MKKNIILSIIIMALCFQIKTANSPHTIITNFKNRIAQANSIENLNTILTDLRRQISIAAEKEDDSYLETSLVALITRIERKIAKLRARNARLEIRRRREEESQTTRCALFPVDPTGEEAPTPKTCTKTPNPGH